MKNKQFHPLAVNILKLQAYSGFFQLDERVMFEWFMVKADSFKTEFYYSIRRIAEETGIRKARLNSILKRFENLSIISYVAKGMPKTYYFLVNRQRVLELLPTIYNTTTNIEEIREKDQHKFYEYGKLLAFFGKQLPENSKHKEKYKNSKEEKTEEKSYSSKNKFSDEDHFILDSCSASNIDSSLRVEDTGSTDNIPFNENRSNTPKLSNSRKDITLGSSRSHELQKALTEVYRERLKLYNSNPAVKKKKVFTGLVFDEQCKQALEELFESNSKESIEGSFTAFVDRFLSGEIKARKPLHYFLAKDGGEFSTFINHWNRFAARYWQWGE